MQSSGFRVSFYSLFSRKLITESNEVLVNLNKSILLVNLAKKRSTSKLFFINSTCLSDASYKLQIEPLMWKILARFILFYIVSSPDQINKALQSKRRKGDPYKKIKSTNLDFWPTLLGEGSVVFKNLHKILYML